MPQNRGNTGQEWFECARCGFDYPIRYRVYQNGKPMCTYLSCVDKKLDASYDSNPLIQFPVEPGGRNNGYPSG